MNKIRVKIIICLTMVVSIVFLSGQKSKAEKIITSHKISNRINIDGFATEKVWIDAEAVKAYDPIADIEITIKSAYDDTNIYFLVNFPDKDESRTHRSWVWDKALGMYKEGPDREDVFVFKWKLDDATEDLTILSDVPYEADIWYWKACRTDPQGFADDKLHRLYSYQTKDSFEVESTSGKKMFLQREGDLGRSTYKTNIYVDYQGNVVNRYTLRQPESSRGDVKAKGYWQEGFWTIEFSRALVTGNSDDLNFSNLNKSYDFGISRYEIAGRPPEIESMQPLFGSGDITEILTLVFQQ